jgi:hypothetical protein
LVVSHGGFIREFINVINHKKELKLMQKGETANTGLYVIKIYCSNCGGACLLTEECNNTKLEFDFILTNDSSHCNEII